MPADRDAPGANATVPHGAGTRDLGRSAVRGFRLTVVEGPDSGQDFSATGDAATIGTHELCDLRLGDGTVSRFHCEVRIEDNGPRVRDTGSTNGTVVDGVRAYDACLRDGSLLRLGRSVVQFQLRAEASRVQVSEREAFGALVGRSVAMRRAFALLERAAPTPATVLLRGETGTGKSQAALSLHRASPRAGGPFVIVDCAAIPANLIESELFGHERGAFTGADRARPGAFEEADGGTLFLDEIGELPTDLQPKLLGVIEKRQVRRVGGNAVRDVDVRLVAATHRDLRTEVNLGRFRADLYFRLAVVQVAMPALRERAEDLPVLAEKLLETLGAGKEQRERLLDAPMRARLVQAAWPGNVRELRNYLERCLVFDEAVPLDDDPAAAAGRPGAAPPAAIDLDVPFTEAKRRAAEAFERAYLEKLLERHGGKVSEAAAAAGIDRTYVYRLLRRQKSEKSGDGVR